MKRLYYVMALMFLLGSLCACGGANTDANTNTESSGNFSDEMVIEDSGNFSTEMFIEASTDVTIIEVQ